MTLVAGLLGGLALLTAWGPPSAVVLGRLRAGSGPGHGHGGGGGAERRLGRLLADPVSSRRLLRAAPVVGVVAVVGGAAVAGVDGALRGLLAAGALVLVGAMTVRRAARRRTATRAMGWQEALEVLRSELTAGRTAEAALTRAAACCPDLMPVVSSMALGGDVTSLLRAIHGVPAAAALAAGWSTAQRSGAGLAVVVGRVVDELTAALEVRREVAAQLATPRATARLLAALPLAGMALGVLIGVDPVHTLLGTTLGLSCLLVGAVLSVAGVIWVDRLAARADLS